MTPLRQHAGLVAAFDRSNIDTDLLLPKAFLKRIGRTGFGGHLFDDLRYLDPYDERAESARRPNPDFLLNRYPWSRASILLARANFGCGSSREHAAWALVEFGIRVVIAESFADIFHSNAAKNGLLAIRLAPAVVDELFELQARLPQLCLLADLEAQRLVLPTARQIPFEADPVQRDALLTGTDEIAATLAHREAIAAFERRRLADEPWL